MRIHCELLGAAAIFATSGLAAQQNEAVVSYLEVYDLDTRTHKVVAEFPYTVEAPNWTPDGNWLVLNTGGKLYKISPDGKSGLIEINTGSIHQCNNDHVISADGKWIGLSSNNNEGKGYNSYVFAVPFGGGEPRQITPLGPSYLHGISPDGKTLAYCAFRPDADGQMQMDVWAMSVKGGKEKRLTSAPGLDDGPEYSPDGKYIWFNSVRSGRMQVWRMKADGRAQTQMTHDTAMNAWFPHVSPDGQKVVYICYHDYEIAPGDHLPNLNVELRMIPSSGGEPETLVKLFGGQGTINVNSWSPDSRKFAYVSYRIKEEIDSPARDMAIQLYSLRTLIGTPELFAQNHDYVLTRVRQMGYTGVEAASYDNGLLYGMEPAEFVKTVERYGLKVISSHVTRFLSADELASGDLSAAMEFWKKVVADHKAAGIPVLAMGMERGLRTEAELKVHAAQLNAIGQLSADAGMRFGYHNHQHEYAKVGQTTMLDYLLQNTDPSKVFFEMDVYWTVIGGASPVEYMKKYPGRFEILHIKDRKELGQSGMVGFDAIFRNSAVAGARAFVVEMEDASSPNILKGLRQSALYLRNANF